ncbi:MAG: PilZ domain-containing protein [Phycisphaerales bacterium]|nr:PilZ domain-containing protein [Phycisphaerales bacterium]
MLDWRSNLQDRLGDHRVAGRVHVEGLSCDRGRIIDLSVRGMRLLRRRAWAPGRKGHVTLMSVGARLTLPARCVWSRRDGMFAWTVGLAFDGATPEQLRTVGELALIHAARLDSRRHAA